MIGFRFLAVVGSSESSFLRKSPPLGVMPASSRALVRSWESRSLLSFVVGFCLSAKTCWTTRSYALAICSWVGAEALVAGQLGELLVDELFGEVLVDRFRRILGPLVLLLPIIIVGFELIPHGHRRRVDELLEFPSEGIGRGNGGLGALLVVGYSVPVGISRRRGRVFLEEVFDPELARFLRSRSAHDRVRVQPWPFRVMIAVDAELAVAIAEIVVVHQA